ncbi:pseudouridine synthase [Xylariaceae sp. FL0016]|nr:pseudouridine synthase [Xylariaceae sp. FL0016]
MDESLDYKRWSKDALIQRVRALESEIQAREQSTAAQPIIPAPEEDGERPKKKKKQAGKLDPSKYSTRLIALKLAYIGKNYGGFEFQVSSNLSTIEEELWKALVKSCLISPEKPEEVNFDPFEYSKCGRTDRGVSAFGQVIAIRVRSNRLLPKKAEATQPSTEDVVESSAQGNMPEAAVDAAQEVDQRPFDDFTDEITYCRTLNRILPPDIRILAWCPTTPEDFSARHHCRERQYRYFFTQPAYSPIPSSLEHPQKAKTSPVKDGWLDIDAMRAAAKKFEGLHDFRNFCKIDTTKNIANFQRRMFESDIVEVKDAETALPYLDREEFRPTGLGAHQKHPKLYYFHVRGSAFLWHQIRCMVSVLFTVGQGLEDPSIIDKLLDVEAEPRRPAYVLADDAPLVLWDCLFPKDLDAADIKDDALAWTYVGEENPLFQHGFSGLVTEMWEYWRERKMDEVLASQLLHIITTQADITLRKSAKAPRHGPSSQRIFEGGNRDRLAGKYQPMLQKTRLASPQEAYDKEARRKGYVDAADMREKMAQRKAEAEAAAAAATAEAKY